MVTECVAILAISLCLVVVFIRAGHGGLRSECHAHPGRSLRASARAAGKLVDRFAFSRACASIGGGVCGYRRRSGFLPYDHVLFGEDQEQEE